MLREKDVLISDLAFPVDTGRKLNVHKTFRRRPGRLLHVLCTFNLRPVSTGFASFHYSTHSQITVNNQKSEPVQDI